MKKISVAVTTFNTSKYLYSCLLPFLKYNFANEIVITDDFSKNEEFQNVENIIRKLNKKYENKIRLFRNEKNLGGFNNKYKTIKKCSNEIVYLFDSDNIPHKKTLSYIKNLINREFDENILYSPGSIRLFKKNTLSTPKRIIDRINIVDDDLVLDKNNIKTNIPESKITNKGMDFVLNIGNFVFDKNVYLENAKAGVNKEVVVGACSIAGSYYWLKNNYKIKFSPNFSHYHRLRPDSYYVLKKETADINVSYFLDQLMDKDDRKHT
ncbi:MAG: hypothetical protein CMC23_05505 [Flavobacteriaceae bacterium]|nr:hypothetical protein [Flavobacteriaceae bacterium]|tara:strand:+ start:11340 stop:12137 length:798 start_codon:yes stop_codon:yes gene_type:complete